MKSLLAVDALALLYVFSSAVGLGAQCPLSVLQVPGLAAGDGVGHSLDVAGIYGVHGTASSESAYIEAWDGDRWVLTDELASPSLPTLTRFGWSVSTDGARIAVGAIDDSVQGALAGAVYVFVRAANGWVLEAELRPGDSAPGDQFGYSVSIDGDRLAIGTPGADGATLDEGAVYIYRGPSSWSQEQRLSASDAALSDAFGTSVSLSGEFLIAGAPRDDHASLDAGSAYVYELSLSTWIERQKLTAADPDPDDRFGFSVDLDGEAAIVGAVQDDQGAPDAGAAYPFDFDGVQWTSAQKLLAASPLGGAQFGHAVARRGGRVLVGAPHGNGMGPGPGAAHYFELSLGAFVEVEQVVPADAATGDRFGWDVALAGIHAWAGSAGDDVGLDADVGSIRSWIPPVGACPPPRQVLSVPVDFATAQEAIAAAQPGDTVLLGSGVHGPLHIDKPLALIGNPGPGQSSPQIQGGEFLPCSFCPPQLESPITLLGPGFGTVLLGGLDVGGSISGQIYGLSPPGITGGQFSELHVHDSIVSAPHWYALTGQAEGNSGISTTTPYVLLSRSFVRASRSGHDSFTTSGNEPDGATALEATGTVVALDSVVQGGTAGPYFMAFDEDCSGVGGPFGSGPTGEGGTGVSSAELIEAGSTILGGAGAAWFGAPDLGPVFSPCVPAPDGPAFSAAKHHVLPNTLQGPGRLTAGKLFEISWTLPSPTVFIGLSVDSQIPIALGAIGQLFLDPSQILHSQVVPAGTPQSSSFTQSTVPALTGLELAFQIFDAAVGLTRPVIAPILPSEPSFPNPAEVGTPLQLDDDDTQFIAFEQGFAFPFYGQVYTGVWFNSNGSLTFTGGDTTFDPVVPQQVVRGLPRIAPAFVDLYPQDLPGMAGTYVHQLTDRVEFTWIAVPLLPGPFTPSHPHTFRVALSQDGRIEFDYVDVKLAGSPYDVSVAISPGGAPKLTVVDYSFDVPFSTGAAGEAIFENFAASSPFDLDGSKLLFTPNARGGFDVD